MAHYLVFLLIQGQYIIPLISDPFGYGWNLFGTAGYRVDIAIVGARFAWYAAVTAIVVGHIAAVYLAHVKAIETFGYRYQDLDTTFERVVGHRTIFPSDFLADFGFVATRWEGQVCLARLELGGLQPVEEGLTARTWRKAKEALAPAPVPQRP